MNLEPSCTGPPPWFQSHSGQFTAPGSREETRKCDVHDIQAGLPACIYKTYRPTMTVRRHRRHSGRRTQAERRSATQTRLLDATTATLADLGWAGLSTTEVSRRAGVSRGAQ